ncbi:hypothetical protein HG530_002964 [Fusarium avenaceum]|uniref:Uncharacterized protein n=3 Tax=Fusarium tricinctum species complex TaxID=679429 RepID=A0A9P7KQN6_9HYPO|nr:hypothetical protein KAF25_007561 [Fusarium avenaceum]KAH6963765.1 hypothetical protein DER45DRAFT_554194 [Fusarium avenaceum]KAH7251929.1 hypothetical protein BKA59DRAFT_473248 [Fusarium tricinctum]KAI6772006.1 hypothetical protein HG530_002964 [Fusarium avenaceum]CAJ0553987.1 Ff.00g124990.m01.CDS01 [Fusarium sp. VM40]
MTFTSTRNSSSSEEQRGRSREPVLLNHNQRTNSYSSEFSTNTTASSTKTSRSWFKTAPQPANKNVHTYCGRHSSQFLFGGPSLVDLAKALLSKD